MKKLLLILALILGMVSFANTGKTKEVEKNALYTLVEKDETGKILNTTQFKTKEELLTYCYDSVTSWYAYTTYDNMGQPWDVYYTTTVRRCITV
ncbi:hypothetical protein [Flavobacterium haoranii]|uniref:YD repeat-containing protein n=1 Tax=Flavobacterium haoranii TaxID=683124 RepID=A0A1M6DS55_9FLAO|nr:hypothetical protein [Flavobacterium haoranii]SHI76005.1 hypothetical protein SAMN05444337_0726 [Flavobacterium haoranii]